MKRIANRQLYTKQTSETNKIRSNNCLSFGLAPACVVAIKSLFGNATIQRQKIINIKKTGGFFGLSEQA